MTGSKYISLDNVVDLELMILNILETEEKVRFQRAYAVDKITTITKLRIPSRIF